MSAFRYSVDRYDASGTTLRASHATLPETTEVTGLKLLHKANETNKISGKFPQAGQNWLLRHKLLYWKYGGPRNGRRERG